MTRLERGAIDARGKVLALQNELWSLIREEAIDAEREVGACLTARRRTTAANRCRAGRAAGRISWRGFRPGDRPLQRLDRAVACDRAVATRRQRRLGQSAVSPAPAAIARAIYQLAVSGALWQHLSYSIMRIGVGWMLGTAAGVVVGFAIGLSVLARSVGITFISALFPIPKIALLPLLILWLGIGEEPKIATIALGVFFSTAISVYSGVDNVPRNLIRMAQSFNVPFPVIVRRVIWPGALPSILAGFRITASVALLLVVSAEMIGAQYGIGAFVLQAGNLMQTDQLWPASSSCRCSGLRSAS